jgi:tetratricopeptide (TPR) repeat protein
MDSLHLALDLSQLSSVEALLAALEPEMEATVRLLLPRTPLLHLLNDLDNLADEKSDRPQRQTLQDLAKLAIARHDYTRRLFTQLTDAITKTSIKDAEDALANLPAEDDGLALQMLGFAARLLADAKLHDKAIFAFQVALSITDKFELPYNRAVVLNQLGFFEEEHGRLNAAEVALKEASDLFARTAPSRLRQNNWLRVRIFLRRLSYEDDPPAPHDFDKLITSDPALRQIVLPVLARKALDRADFTAAEEYLSQLRTGSDPATPPRAGVLLVEAKLARRLERFETAQLLLSEAAAAEDAGEFAGELLREKFYFARDFGKQDEARGILTELRQSDTSAELLYQDALVRWQDGERSEAEKLFRECLDRTSDDTIRANCLGMLGQCVQSYADSMRYFYSAIGLYLKLDRKLDHAISLSNLGLIELVVAESRKKEGVPLLAIHQFSRADHLLQAAQTIAERLGDVAFTVSTIENRARLERGRGRRRVALRHFDVAARQIELCYLALSDRQQAEFFFARNASIFDQAVQCAREAERPRDVLSFSERGKARRLLRDTAEMSVRNRTVPDMYKSFFSILPPGAAKDDTLSEAEKLLVTVVQPLRTRLLQGRPVSMPERKALHDAQAQLAAFRTESADSRPLGWEEIRARIFGVPAPPITPEQDEDIEELPGGGIIICRCCLVYNQIGSSFCSACEIPQPKSATINLDVILGYATESEEKAALADHFYNHSVRLFHDGKITEAESFIDQAMQLTRHPDYSFFHGLYRLAAGDASGALNDFKTVKSLQYAGEKPFWPLPVSPSDLGQAIELLVTDGMRTAEVLENLVSSYGALAARRAEVLA